LTFLRLCFIFLGVYIQSRDGTSGSDQKEIETYVVSLLLALLRATAEAENEVKGGLLLDVIIVQRTSIFELLSGENETLLVRRNARVD
jgi:hypothetical protein